MRRPALYDWAGRHRNRLICSIIVVAVAALVAHRPEAAEYTIGDYLESLRQCVVPDLIYCGGSVFTYRSGGC